MRLQWRSFCQMITQLKSSPIMFIVLVAPILFGVVYANGIPLMERALTKYFHESAVLSPYYEVFDLFLAILTSAMFAYVIAMSILEEIDERVTKYFIITPLGKRGYILSRLLIPTILSFCISVLVLSLFSLKQTPVLMLLLISSIASLQGVIIVLMIVSLSSNKLEGVAVSKLSSLFCIGFVIPYVLHTNLQYLFGILPSFWFGKAVQSISYFPLALSLFTTLCWIFFLLHKFNKKMSA